VNSEKRKAKSEKRKTTKPKASESEKPNKHFYGIALLHFGIGLSWGPV